MTKKRKHILFERIGFGYMPVNLTGWLLFVLYLSFALPFLIIPQIIFPHSGIVSGYQLVAFLLLWWLGLRFAKRDSE